MISFAQTTTINIWWWQSL